MQHRKSNLEKRNFSEISAKEKLIQELKIPKKPKTGPVPSLADYLKSTSILSIETPRKCVEYAHKVHEHISICYPPKWQLKPVLADEFCLYFEDLDLHVYYLYSWHQMCHEFD